MNELLVKSRAAMLDAIEALEPHRDSIIVIGAHAIYIRIPESSVAIAQVTKDSDLAIDMRTLEDAPTLEVAMQRAGFVLEEGEKQPGLWFRDDGTEVDLMVPESFAGLAAKNRRGARIPPHSKRAARRARGLEATLVDNDVLPIGALDPNDGRVAQVKVAGLAALLVSKLFKLAEREDSAPSRLVDKDAHDVYRILQGADLEDLTERYLTLLSDEVSKDVAKAGLNFLKTLFATGPEALGSMMAGRNESGIGEPEIVSVQVTLLANELLTVIGDQTTLIE